MNKTLGYLLSLLVVAGAIIGIAFAVKSGNRDVVVTPENGNTIEMCYVWNTEAGDHADLRLNLSGTGGSQVTGEFNFVPAEKDSKIGTFAGTAGMMDPMTSSRTADVIWQANAEGMQTPEQLIIKFGEGSAAAGFGEMKDRGDGTYVYVNPASLSYVPTLSQVDCNDSAMNKPMGKLPAGSPANGDVSKLTANSWVWIATNKANGTDVTPKKAGVFSLSFATDGRVSGTTDCNGFGGSYTSNGTNLSFGSFMSTLMYCDGSQESVFTGSLAAVKSYEIDASGTLVLKLGNGDTMAFRKK